MHSSLLARGSQIPTITLLKRIVLILLPLTIVYSFVLYASIRFEEQKIVHELQIREESRIQVASDQATKELSTVDAQLRLISNLPSLHKYLDTGDISKRVDLEQFFLETVRQTDRYDQIRYLDAYGQEQIRVDYQAGHPIVVPRDKLQNKSKRYYFSDTFKLDHDQAFVSPFDLNIENGRLEIPYKPMIRFGTPVFDNAGHKKGVIILNYLGVRLQRSFQKAMLGDHYHQSFLLNRDGYWLSRDNNADEFGFMLGKSEHTFQSDYPDVGHVISSNENGSMLTPQGLFVYTTIYPLQAGESTSSGSPNVYSSSSQDIDHQQAFWKVLSFIPTEELTRGAFYKQPFIRLVIIFAYFLLALAAFSMATITLRRKLAQEEIVRLNAELKRKIIEHAKGEENLSVTLHSIGDGVLVTDANGCITRLNPVSESLTGWTQAEAIGRPVAEVFNIINQETRKPAFLPVESTLAKGAIQGLANHTVLISRDGTEYAIADSCAPIRDLDGGVIGAVLVFRDVTKEYAAQAAIQDSAKRAQTVLDSVGEGIHGIDTMGRIMFENPASAKMLGWDVSEMIGKPAHELIHHTRADGTAYPKEQCIIYAALEGSSTWCVEDEVFWRKDGSSFPVSYNVSPMRNHVGEVIGVIVSFSDITQRKQVEQQLVTAKDLADSANHAKDSFLATMSHEIRTPLSGLLGMMELLEYSKLDAKQQTLLHSAQTSGKGLLRIVNDILDWSKIEAGKLDLAPQATRIKDTLQGVMDTYVQLANEKNLELKLTVDEKLAEGYVYDPLRVSQILNNFTSNAIKFTPNGNIQIRAELIAKGDGKDTVRLSVKDSGIGISPEQQQSLFKQYHQASASTARMYGGTGLGLSICRKLAQMMGGAVSMDSKLGEGSTFMLVLELPSAEMPNTAGSSSAEAAYGARAESLSPITSDGRAIRILVADDHPINRLLIKQQMEMLGLAMDEAPDGVAALSLWQSGNYDLVITDCNMPGMDGYELSQRIRSLELDAGRPRTPIIAWTANAMTEDAEHCHAAGMDDVLTKPADLIVLKSMLSKFLGKLSHANLQ